MAGEVQVLFDFTIIGSDIQQHIELKIGQYQTRFMSHHILTTDFESPSPVLLPKLSDRLLFLMSKWFYRIEHFLIKRAQRVYLAYNLAEEYTEWLQVSLETPKDISVMAVRSKPHGVVLSPSDNSFRIFELMKGSEVKCSRRDWLKALRTIFETQMCRVPPEKDLFMVDGLWKSKAEMKDKSFGARIASEADGQIMRDIAAKEELC